MQQFSELFKWDSEVELLYFDGFVSPLKCLEIVFFQLIVVMSLMRPMVKISYVLLWHCCSEAYDQSIMLL